MEIHVKKLQKIQAIKEELGQIKDVITESKPSNETMKLSIGKHVFEGKITTVKKLK